MEYITSENIFFPFLSYEWRDKTFCLSSFPKDLKMRLNNYPLPTKKPQASLLPALSHHFSAGEAGLSPQKPRYGSSNLSTPPRCLWAHHPWHPNRTLGGTRPAAAGWSWYRKERKKLVYNKMAITYLSNQNVKTCYKMQLTSGNLKSTILIPKKNMKYI